MKNGKNFFLPAIAGKIGEEMFSDLSAVNVKMCYINTPSTVSDIFSDYQNGDLEVARASNSARGFGRSKVRLLNPW